MNLKRKKLSVTEHKDKNRKSCLILTKLEAVEALGDAVSVGSIGLNVLAEELSSGDAFPLEILGEGLQVLLTATAGGSKQENATNYIMKKHW